MRGVLRATIRRSSAIVRTPRLMQMLGMFDVPPAQQSDLVWEVKLDLPQRWNIGAIVGPSGCGKTTIARELFGPHIVERWDWPADKSILDGFPAALGIKQITGLLSSVGFSSPPAWVRPFAALSNGQQFRVNLARTLAELPDLAVVDEFTSVVDRTVARIGSAAVAKAVRRSGQKFVAITCHYDILDWLDPDWTYEPETGKFAVADAARGSVRRPPIELEIVRVDSSAWKLFKPHHYLSGNLHRAARCFAAMCEGRPAAFCAVISFPHPNRPGWREHRTVCLPDFQGVGIGNALSEFVGSMMVATGKSFFSTTGHPGMIAHRRKSRFWKCVREPKVGKPRSENAPGSCGMRKTIAFDRITGGFEYVGPSRPDEARAAGILCSPETPGGYRPEDRHKTSVPLTGGLRAAIRRELARTP